MQPRQTVQITRKDNGTTVYHYRAAPPLPPRYTLGQTVVVTFAGLAVGSFLAWVIVSAACRALEWAWS
jgi:hypothetical protein